MASKGDEGGRASTGNGVLRVIGRDRYVEFTLDETLPLTDLEQGLREYLANTTMRFAGARVSLNLGNRPVRAEEIAELKRLLEEEYHLVVAGVFCGLDALGNLLEQSGGVRNEEGTTAGVDEQEPVPVESSPEQPTNVLSRLLLDTEPAAEEVDAAEALQTEGRETLLVRGTCRSGTTIHNAGNVVVLGDVNPGAEVTATQDVIIFGRLGGLAHAGAGGSGRASVIALSIEASQVRIGPHILMGAAAPRRGAQGYTPEIAAVRDGNIVVEPFVARSVWNL